jgi:hypothetical protein
VRVDSDMRVVPDTPLGEIECRGSLILLSACTLTDRQDGNEPLRVRDIGS